MKQQYIEKLEEEIRILKELVTDLGNANLTLTEENKDLKSDMSNLEWRLECMEDDLWDVECERDELLSQVEELEERIEELEEEM